jgi:hypothetical protein
LCSMCAWLTTHLADLSATPPSGSSSLRQRRLISSTLFSLSRQNRDNERGVASTDGAQTIGSVETLRADGAFNLLNEERGVEDTVNVTGIVTVEKNQYPRKDMREQTTRLPEEDTTEGGESAQEVGLPRDRRLGHVDIGGSMDGRLADSVLGLLGGSVHDGHSEKELHEVRASGFCVKRKGGRRMRGAGPALFESMHTTTPL